MRARLAVISSAVWPANENPNRVRRVHRVVVSTCNLLRSRVGPSDCDRTELSRRTGFFAPPRSTYIYIYLRSRRNDDGDAENTCTDANPARSTDTASYGAGRSRTYTHRRKCGNNNIIKRKSITNVRARRRRRRDPINEPSDNKRHRPNTRTRNVVFIVYYKSIHAILFVYTRLCTSQLTGDKSFIRPAAAITRDHSAHKNIMIRTVVPDERPANVC